MLLNEQDNRVATIKIENFMKQNRYSNPCIDFAKDYWPQVAASVIGAATLTYLGREALYLKLDASGLGQVKRLNSIYKLLVKLGGPAKKVVEENPEMFSNKSLFKLSKKSKFKLGIAVVIAAIGGYTAKKVYDDMLTANTKQGLMIALRDATLAPVAALGGGFERAAVSTRDSQVGRGTGMQGNDCAPIAMAMILAATTAITIAKTKPVRPINTLLDKTLDTFMKFLKRTKTDIQQAVSTRIVKVMEEKASIPQVAKEEILDIIQTTPTYNIATREQANNRILALGLDPKVQKECDDIIELTFQEGVYRSKEVFGELEDEALKAARKADDILAGSGKKVREQMGFAFDNPKLDSPRLDAPTLDQVPAIVNNIDQAFDNQNIRDAIRQLEELAQFYRSKGMLEDGNAKAKVIRMVQEIRKEFPGASDYDVIRTLLKRSGEIFTEINFKDAEGLTAKMGIEQLQVSDEVAENILRNEVDEVLFYQTSNLPLPPPRKSPSPRDEFPELREATVNSTMGFYQTLKGKVPNKIAIKLSLGALGLLFADIVYSAKENRPTGSPYYFEDKSIYDKLGLNFITGQNRYKEIRDNLLTDPGVMKDINSFIFDHNRFKSLRNVLEVEAKSERSVIDVDSSTDRLLKKYVKAVQIIYTMDRGRSDTLGQLQRGEEGTIKDRNRFLADNQLVFEIFLFNDAIIKKLTRFYEDEQKNRSTSTRRMEKLKKIFAPSRSHQNAANKKIQKLDKYFANDFRSKTNKKIKEVIFMSKKDIRQLVAEVLNENSGQGYGKYPYHSNEYSESEPDQDYQVEWKAFVDECCGRKVKNVDGDPSTVEDMAVEVAKIFVKDSDLFRDVLEMAGSNKSIGVEIMQQLKAAKEKKKLDKEMNV